jgi:pantothenate kinase-related protein Tda10
MTPLTTSCFTTFRDIGLSITAGTPSTDKMPQNKAIIVGISGCSSSGKTTLARLLRDIFPNTFILHEDDFYKPEEQ